MKERKMKFGRRSWAALSASVLLAAACGGGEPVAEPVYEENVPPPISSETVILATTSILGDIARNVAGDRARVDVMMPVGTDPHDYVPSAELVNSIYRANLVISGGFSLEERMTDVLEIAKQEGVNLFEIGEAALADHEAEAGEDAHDHEGEEAGEDAHDHEEGEAGEDAHDHEGEEAGEDAHDHEGEEAGEDAHDHEGEEAGGDSHDHEGEAGEDAHEEDGHAHAHGTDPHFWMDPILVAEGALALGEKLTPFDGSEEWMAGARAYVDQLTALDMEIREILAVVPPERRKLITGHDAFGYFAQRYGFEVLGTIIPSTHTLAEPGSAHLAELVELIIEHDIPAVFVDNIDSPDVGESLAAEAGAGVRVVELYSGSLGAPGSGAETLIAMLRVNAQRIAEALA